MNKKSGNLMSLIAMLAVVISCGKSEKSGDITDLSEYFPAQFEDLDLVRLSEVRTFEGQSLFEYINGGAEIYHLYDFVDVATAFYKINDKEIVLDIYRFETDDNAYGLYTSIKPLGPGNIQLGIEGFSTDNSVDFVKGKHVVRVVGFDESEATKNAVKNLAEKVSELVPGSTERPKMFGLFPLENIVPGSEKMLAESFLGRIFLKDVYTMDYENEGDEATLFITEDPNGEKYIKWFLEVEPEDADLSGFTYDNQKSFLFDNDYYGEIAAGLKNGKLAGMIGYKESHRGFLSRWLESLNKSI